MNFFTSSSAFQSELSTMEPYDFWHRILIYRMRAIITRGLYTPFLKAKNVYLRSFFCKILTLCMVSIQEGFIIKSGLWWRAYGNIYLFSLIYFQKISFAKWQTLMDTNVCKYLIKLFDRKNKNKIRLPKSFHFIVLRSLQLKFSTRS